MHKLTSEDEIQKLLDDRPERTETYEVPRELLERVPRDEKYPLRTMDDYEVRELAEFLEADVAELQGPFQVVDAKCANCGRQLTFLDFARTAVEKGPHDKAQLREILTGRAGAWLTIRGRDGGRPVSCVNCDTARMPDYSEYSSSSYAYA